jgi:RNA polymerase sigma factor (sigma-70 family)
MKNKLTDTYNRKEHIEQLYLQVFPVIAAFVRKMNGSLEEAKDIFQDALVIYYEKTLNGQFTPKLNEQAYLIGISRHLWFKNYRNSKQIDSLENQLNYFIEDENEPKIADGLLKFVEQSGRKCMELLSSFYYEQLNMKEIALRFGFSGERSATVQKFKCLEKVRHTIRKRALSKEDFYA